MVKGKSVIQKEEAILAFKNLNLSDSFLFGEVMQDSDTCKIVLEIILGRKIHKIDYVSKEKHMDVDKSHKGIRLDVYFEDDKETAYSVEMQNENRFNIPRRSRHYQSVIDIKLLPVGEVDYNQLKDGVIIFICSFDLFEYKRYCYTFENRCVEIPELSLGDGTRKVFLNTGGENDAETRPELIDFLKYVKNSKSTVPKTELVKKVAERTEKVKRDSMAEARYMMSLVHDNEIRFIAKEEGRQEGLQEGLEEGQVLTLIKLTVKKLSKGMTVAEIAELLGEDSEFVQRIDTAMKKINSEDSELIYQYIKNEN